VYRAVYGQHEAAWFSWIDALGRIGAVGTERMAGLFRVARNAGWWWPFRGVVILTERACELHRDAQGRLHHETGPAMAYPDGFAIHAWHGVRVPADLIEDGWSTKRILAEPNAEIRRCAIERLGWDQFIADARLKRIGKPVPDPGNPGCEISLYDVPEKIYDERVRVLLCTNGTVERDGTRRRFGLTTPAHFSDPVAAAAWTFDFPVEAYRSLQFRR